MKRKGKLSLINHTVYDWIKIYQRSYQMTCWQFPEIIPANCAVDVEIEWPQKGASKDRPTDGLASYVLFGSRDRSFQIKAPSANEYDIQIYFSNLVTEQFPLGSTINLKWEHNKRIQFRLSGTADVFYNDNKSVESVI